ncbi:isoform A, Ecdysone-induced protein 75B [Lucilia cuprina]|nr:isoform A, Ecdysone-induced protein 75B [Lucilia cuprina]
MYSRLKGCLQTIINQNRPDQPDFMSKLLETMPVFAHFEYFAHREIGGFRTEHKELLRQQMWSMEDEQPSLSRSPHNWKINAWRWTSSLASSAPLLAATLSGTCPLRNRANSGSSGDSTNELDMVTHPPTRHECGNEKNECSKNVSSGGSSSCSSPRSSVDDALDCNVVEGQNNSGTQVTVSVSPVRSPQPLSQQPASSTPIATTLLLFYA